MAQGTSRTPSDNEFYLTNSIKELREKEGFSQVELAERAGVPQKTISRIENGLTIPTLATLEKIIQALGHEISVRIN